MKNVKSFLAKNFLILAFAIGGIFAVTSNVTVSGNNPQHTTGTGTGDGNKQCMLTTTGSGIYVYARTCISSPGSIPAYECGRRTTMRNGLRYTDCYWKILIDSICLNPFWFNTSIHSLSIK